MEPIILASASPRRQEILKKMGIPYTVYPAGIKETTPEDLKKTEVSEFLSAKKVSHVVQELSKNREIGWVLGADTTILFKNKILGKPRDEDEAREFISKLQGNTHKVITGITLYNGKLYDISCRTSVNSVTFAPMSQKEIDWYISTGEWHGVAGGYRIQGQASLFISSIDGSESSIMGLPIFELYDILREQNYSFLK